MLDNQTEVINEEVKEEEKVLDVVSRPNLGTVIRENIWLILIVVILGINAVLLYQNFIKQAPVIIQNEPITEEPSGPPEGMVESVLSGEYISENDRTARPIAVMIDNYPTARPDSGISNASIVWEVPVEGGVTRLLAVFQTTKDIIIGPVRSSREYFLPLVKEVDAVYAHSGGSPKAIELLQEDKTINNADEFSNGRAYFRRSNFEPPHNLFTTILKMGALIESFGWNRQPKISALLASDKPHGDNKIANLVVVNPSLAPYRVRWRWDKEEKKYFRSIGGDVSTDRETSKEIGVENVIVEFTEVKPAPRANVPDAVAVKVIGSGEAWLFRDGVGIRGRWEKKDDSSRTVFLTDNNESLPIAHGKVWIEIVPNNKEGVLTYE